MRKCELEGSQEKLENGAFGFNVPNLGLANDNNFLKSSRYDAAIIVSVLRASLVHIQRRNGPARMLF